MGPLGSDRNVSAVRRKRQGVVGLIGRQRLFIGVGLTLQDGKLLLREEHASLSLVGKMSEMVSRVSRLRRECADRQFTD